MAEETTSTSLGEADLKWLTEPSEVNGHDVFGGLGFSSEPGIIDDGFTALPSTTPPPLAMSRSGSLQSVRSRSRQMPGMNMYDRGMKRVRTRSFPEVKAARRLACPFTKVDATRFSPRNYNEKNYRGCSSCVLRQVANVRQHLRRVHKKPNFFCSNCYRAFDYASGLGLHQQRGIRCEPRRSPFLSDYQLSQLKSGETRAKTRNPVESWYEVFEMLFPDQPRPSDPYASSHDVHLSASWTVLSDFQSVFRDRLLQTSTLSEEDRQTVVNVLDDSLWDMGTKLQRETLADIATLDACKWPSTSNPAHDVDMDEFINISIMDDPE